MARRYRKKQDTLDEKKAGIGSRLFWIIVGLIGIILVVCLGISTSKPQGSGLLVTAIMGSARIISSFAGDFSVYLCFLIVLTAIFKIVQLQEPLPKPVWGFWVLLIFTSSLWHHAKIPWEETFSMARMGAGGGILGAGLNWFFQATLGKTPALVILSFGLLVGLSLLINKSPSRHLPLYGSFLSPSG